MVSLRVTIGLYVWFGLSAFSLQAGTGILKGKVVDAETGQGLPGANVLVRSAQVNTGTATAPSGEFALPNLPGGRYTVTVTFIGYERFTTRVALADGDSLFLDVTLQPVGILLNPVTITASKRPEKLLDAPASITVLSAREVESRVALTAAEHLKALPAVDIITAGLNQSRVVIRGFNNLLSGSLLSLVDYRITRIPAIRLNAFQMISTSNEDVERVELVSGPASALYGPNSANGVMHVITKSPFDSKGTTVSLGGGEQSVFLTGARHAGTFGDKVGYKISFQHYSGNDFVYIDSVEAQLREEALRNTTRPDTVKVGKRIFDINSTNLDARLDFRLARDLTLVTSAGFSRGDNIEMTDQGAAQALKAGFSYVQARLRYRNFFFHTFFNKIHTGETYFLRNGQNIINNSSLFAVQAQHGFSLGPRQNFTYGLDVLLTRPITAGTVNGRNEDNDDVNEIGGYLQSETVLSKKLQLVAAARLDHHNRLPGLKFSPRLALVFKPTPSDNFRVTFNRAYTTPTTDQLFTDTIGTTVSTRTDPRLEALRPYIGDTLYNIRSLGPWPNGLSFKYGTDGRPQMVTVFGDTLARMGQIPEANAYLAPDVNAVWPVLRQLFIANAGEVLPDFLLNLINLEEVFPQQLSRQVPGVFKVINPETLGFDEVDPSWVQDVAPLKESINTTFEVGYKGLLHKKLLASVDVYHTRIEDFIGTLRVETPSVFIDRKALAEVLADDIQAPDVVKDLLVSSIANDPRIDSLAIGIISPTQVQNGTDVLLTYRNLGDVSVIGADVSLTYQLNQNWSLTGNYSFVNRDFFKGKDARFDIALNAPKHKVGAIVWYRTSDNAFDGSLRLRFVDSFPASSGIFTGKVDRYAILDLNASYWLPFLNGTRLTLTVQNLTNNKHQEFLGLPKIERLAWLRVTHVL